MSVNSHTSKWLFVAVPWQYVFVCFSCREQPKARPTVILV